MVLNNIWDSFDVSFLWNLHTDVLNEVWIAFTAVSWLWDINFCFAGFLMFHMFATCTIYTGWGLGGLSSNLIPHDMSPQQSSHGQCFGATVLRGGEELVALDFCMVTIIKSLQYVWLLFSSWIQSWILINLKNQCLQSGWTLEMMEQNLARILATCAWRQICQHHLLLYLKPKSLMNLLEHLIQCWAHRHHHRQLPNQYQAAGGVCSSYLSGRACIFLLLL